jgi:hypothetical protein
MPETNGKRFIERLMAASPTERRKFSVLDQDIYVRPLTRKAMADALPRDGIEREPDYIGLFLLVHCAEAEDGSRLFDIRDIDALRECVSLELLQQIEGGIMGVISPSDKQVQEDIKSDPPFASV